MGSPLLNHTVPLVLSGWEPHNVVWWTRQIVQHGFTRPEVRVVGREPVTSTAVFLDGTIVEERHESYDRGFTVRSRGGEDFKVGGTNTTSSIAALFTIIQVPSSLLPEGIDAADTIPELSSHVLGGGSLQDCETVLVRMEYWLRGQRITQLLDRTLLTYMPRARPFLAEATSHSPRETASDGALYSGLMVDVCAQAIERWPEVAGHATRVLSLLGDQRCLQLLVQYSRSRDPAVSRPSALSLRALEFEFQACQLASPLLATALLDDLARELRESTDPETRVYLAEDLGYLNPNYPAVASALADALRNDESMDVKWSSAVALGRTIAPASAAEALVSQLDDTACHVRVKRSALVSLGRLLHRWTVDLADAAMTRHEGVRIAHTIELCMEDPDPTVAAYALFAIGELPDPTEGLLRRVSSFLTEDTPYVTLAHAVLALYKHDVRDGLPEEVKDVVVDAVPRLMSITFDKGHPGSSYHEWFLLTCWRLLSRLEEPDSAAQFAREASRVLAAQPSRAMYFRALADLQHAEHLLASGLASTATALQAFERALREFQNVAVRTAFEDGSLNDVSAMSAVTRATWVKSRIDFLTCLERLEQFSFDADVDDTEVELTLKSVRAQIDSILASRPQATLTVGPVLPVLNLRTAPTEGILAWFRSATFLVAELSAMRRGLAQDDTEEKLVRLRARTRAAMTRMRAQADTSASRQLQETQGHLSEISVEWLSAETRADLFETSATGLSAAVRALRTPVPIPDIEHQLIGRGRASFALYQKGLGTSNYRKEISDAVEVIAGETLGIRAVVRVDLLSDDEMLLLRWASATGSQTGAHIVQIHEGLETTQIQFDQIEGEDEIELVVELSFTSAGYSEVIQRETIRVTWAVPDDLDSEAGVNQLRRLLDEGEALRRDLELYGVQGGERLGGVRSQERELAQNRRVVDTLAASFSASGGSVPIHLLRKPVNQKNGVLLTLSPHDEVLVQIAVEIAERVSGKTLPTPEVISRGRTLEMLVAPNTYNAIRDHLSEVGTSHGS